MELKAEITVIIDQEKAKELGFSLDHIQTHFTQVLENCLSDYMLDLVLSSYIVTKKGT